MFGKKGCPADQLLESFFVEGKLDRSSKPSEVKALDVHSLFSKFLDGVLSNNISKYKKIYFDEPDDAEIRRDLVTSIRGVPTSPSLEEEMPIGKNYIYY